MFDVIYWICWSLVTGAGLVWIGYCIWFCWIATDEQRTKAIFG